MPTHRALTKAAAPLGTSSAKLSKQITRVVMRPKRKRDGALSRTPADGAP